MTAFLNEQPDADRQQLRQLLRNVQKENEASKPPKSSRLLYRYLKTLLNIEGEAEWEDEVEGDNEQNFEDDIWFEDEQD